MCSKEVVDGFFFRLVLFGNVHDFVKPVEKTVAASGVFPADLLPLLPAYLLFGEFTIPTRTFRDIP